MAAITTSEQSTIAFVECVDEACTLLDAAEGTDEEVTLALEARNVASISKLCAWNSGQLRDGPTSAVPASAMIAFLAMIFDPTASPAITLADSADSRAAITLTVQKAMERATRASNASTTVTAPAGSRRRARDDSSDDEADEGRKKSTLDAYTQLLDLQGRAVPLQERAQFVGRAARDIREHGYFASIPAVEALKLLGCASHGSRLKLSKGVNIDLDATDKVRAALMLVSEGRGGP